jgi:diguanylate cyclase (GGDEF)-like protein/PAS domain S-box-containing protein
MTLDGGLPIAMLDILPNPVLVKDDQLRYVWVNRAFEALFDVERKDLVGELDTTVFSHRQAVQCNGGDTRVLESGEVDEASETVIDSSGDARETLTRKSRLVLDGATYLVGVMHDITDVTRANEMLQVQSLELEMLANTDPLTGCLNRRALFNSWDDLEAPDAGTGIVMIDADHFKGINDSYGHEAGDEVLVQIAAIVRSELGPDDLFSRFGGEEFVLVLPGRSLAEATELGEQIRTAVSEGVISTNEGLIRVTVSAGIAHCTSTDRSELDQALLGADRSLYLAKEQGRNRVLAA